MTDEPEPPLRILAIDGGGVRGVIPARLLAEIERLTGRPINESFDMVAGTSTGALLALGLTCTGERKTPRPADLLLSDYQEDARKIFSRRPKIAGVPVAMYDAKRLRETVESRISGPLSDARCEVLIPTYDLGRAAPRVFRSWSGPADDYDVVDVAVAACAAPFFFKPADTRPLTPGPRSPAIDGGVYANNPALLALLDARARYPGRRCFVVSIGTGDASRGMPADHAISSSRLRMAPEFLQAAGDGVSWMIDAALEAMLPVGDYVRLQVKLPFEARLDDASSRYLADLIACAEQYIKHNGPRLARISRGTDGRI